MVSKSWLKPCSSIRIWNFIKKNRSNCFSQGDRNATQTFYVLYSSTFTPKTCNHLILCILFCYNKANKIYCLLKSYFLSVDFHFEQIVMFINPGHLVFVIFHFTDASLWHRESCAGKIQNSWVPSLKFCIIRAWRIIFEVTYPRGKWNKKFTVPSKFLLSRWGTRGRPNLSRRVWGHAPTWNI